MKNQYGDFFKKAKQTKRGAQTSEQILKSALHLSKSGSGKSRPRFVQAPWKVVIPLSLGIVFFSYGYFNPTAIDQILEMVDIGVLAAAEAAGDNKSKNAGNEGDKSNSAGEKNTPDKSESSEKTAERSGSSAGTENCPEPKAWSEEEFSHFSKLNERKKNLDQREKELSELEEELHKQRSEVEARMQKLEAVRNEIASVLKDRVEVDQQRVTTLVDFYSTMKPKQAAEIIGNLNEDLAVEVLGKMKKKNAADIMNLLEPAKAKTLSEKYTGYQRR